MMPSKDSTPVSSVRTGPVAGIVLAAGSSTRLGRNKLLIPVQGESLIRRTVSSAAAILDPVIVVLGHEAERVTEELTGLPCRSALNPDHARGINSSLRAGLAALPDGVRAAVVLLADMPLVTSGMISDLVQRYRTSAAPLVISDYDGVLAPPLLYDQSLFAELGAMEGEGCGKQVVRRHREQAEVLTWAATALTDLDVPADYERIQSLLATES